MHSKTIIEIQYFKNCPNAPILISRVQEAIKDLDQIGYQEVLIETNEMAEENKFRGSPTLLIDGEDFEGTPEPEESFLSCRYYKNGLPTVEHIKETLTGKN